MAHSMRQRIDAVHPQMLRVESEELRKKLAAHREAIGCRVERALQLVGITKQEAAFVMGYADQGPVSRWCTGLERPLLDKLFLIDGFEDAWLVASAERNPRMVVETTVKIRRIA